MNKHPPGCLALYGRWFGGIADGTPRIAKDVGYDDQLNYDLFPKAGTNGYNSNSYVRGLIYAGNSSSVVDFDSYVGGDKSVLGIRDEHTVD